MYLGGGYPELYAKVLQDNFSMRASIKNAVDSGLPCIAECGGFMYLMKAFRDKNGQVYDWAGVVDGETYMMPKLPEQKHGKRFTQRRTFTQAIRTFICGAIQSLL